jgi:hypothetical protein
MTPLQQNVTSYLYELGGETAVDVFMWAQDQPWCDRHGYIAERLALLQCDAAALVDMADATGMYQGFCEGDFGEAMQDLKRFFARRMPEVARQSMGAQ